MRSKADQSAKLKRLDDLATSPGEQVSYALELLETERSLSVLQVVLPVVAENPTPTSRQVLLKKYEECDADGTRRDPGGYVRGHLLRALRYVARRDDLALLERAAATYEFMPPGRSEVASEIRANALVAMNELDPDLAGYHCVRLLADQYTSRMSGEPAVTALRILAAQSQILPLYYFALQNSAAGSEVLSEALRNLTHIPASLLTTVVEKHRETRDEIVLVGLFDLILGHESGGNFDAIVVEFLRTTRMYDVHRYVAAAIVANRKTRLQSRLIETAEREDDRRRLENLVEALSLVRGDRSVEAAVARLRVRFHDRRKT